MTLSAHPLQPSAEGGRPRQGDVAALDAARETAVPGHSLSLARLMAENAELRSSCEKYRRELELMRDARAMLSAELDQLMERNARHARDAGQAAIGAAGAPPAVDALETANPGIGARGLLGGDILGELDRLLAAERQRHRREQARPWLKKLLKYPRQTLLATFSHARTR